MTVGGDWHGRKAWFLHHMPHGMMMLYWGVQDGREHVGQVPASIVTLDAPSDVADTPSPPDAVGGSGYAPIERG